MRINLSNKLAYTFIALAILILVAFGINALTPLTPGVAPNPGHTIDTVAPPSPCTADYFLQFDGTYWKCAAASGGSSQWQDVLGGITYSGGGVGIGASPSSSIPLTILSGASYEIAGSGTEGFNIYSPTDMFLLSDGKLRFGSSGINGQVILNNGNLGIGTSSPGYKLDVSGDRIRLQGGGKSIMLRTDGGAVDFDWTGAPLYFDGGGNIYLNPSNGNNVGIGTTSPTQKLDVAGNVKATQFCLGATPCISSWPSGGGIGGGGGDRYIPRFTGTSALMNSIIYQDATSGYERIGIGTQFPSSTLQVVGTVRASAVSTDNLNSIAIDFTGELRSNGHKPIQIAKIGVHNDATHFVQITNTNYPIGTGFDFANWWCETGSFKFTSGDINEFGSGDPVKFYTCVNPDDANRWWAYFNFNSQAPHESFEGWVVCYDKDLVDLGGNTAGSKPCTL